MTPQHALAIDAVRNGHGKMIHSDEEVEEYTIHIETTCFVVTYFIENGSYIAENAHQLINH